MTIYPTETLPANVVTRTVELKGIGKQYPLKSADNSFADFWALKDISLDAHKGEVLGVIGRNGAGKTTLLNIIAGILSPTKGSVLNKGKVLGLFNLGVGFQDELTGRENIFLNGAIIGFSKKELEEKLNAIIEFSELGDFINMPLGSYSQGMRLRLGFSIIANLDFDILVIDEVLAVGDALFQSKCFQRLADFKRQGKTLIITTQDVALVERLCDRAALLDHGRLLFNGDVTEAANRYRALLNTEKFFVGYKHKNTSLITNTKKWADDISEWGKAFGTKEAVIEKVEFISKWGLRCTQIKSGQSLKIKVYFAVKNKIKDVHFGVAIFRNDGVYCYGPNTKFDGHKINQLNSGKGSFTLDLEKVSLAPGEYKISAAIWDNDEAIAFDHHFGCYQFSVNGNNVGRGLSTIPFNVRPAKKLELGESLRILDSFGKEKNVFNTNELVRFIIQLKSGQVKGQQIYFKLFREDDVYCQGKAIEFVDSFEIIFPHLSLLPGSYYVSLEGLQLMRKFQMASERHSHGTVYLEHKWSFKFPK